MGILTWIIFGLIVGAIAKFLMPGRDPGGIIITILIGIVGAVIGGFIGSQLGFGDVDGLQLPEHDHRRPWRHRAAPYLPDGSQAGLTRSRERPSAKA